MRLKESCYKCFEGGRCMNRRGETLSAGGRVWLRGEPEMRAKWAVDVGLERESVVPV